MLSPETQAQLAAIHENAICSVKAILKCLKDNPDQTMTSIYKIVAVDFDVSARTLENRMRQYREQGWKGLVPSHGGRSFGEDRDLSPVREAEIQSIITDQTPDQLKMPFALWTRKAVQELILSRYSILLSITCVGNYLRRWGFTCQRPKLTAIEQKPEQVKRWLEEEYPAIKAKAKAENAEIWWGDETAVQNAPHQLRGFSPKGQTPVLKSYNKRIHLTMVSAVNNQGLVRFRMFSKSINVDGFKEFLEAMIRDADKRKIILIVDNLKVHHAIDLQPWLKLHEQEIELRFLPSYSPDLNPDEYLNRDMKSRLGGMLATKDPAVLNSRVEGYMGRLENDLDLVKSFFRYTPSRYAA
jgi:transposase